MKESLWLYILCFKSKKKKEEMNGKEVKALCIERKKRNKRKRGMNRIRNKKKLNEKEGNEYKLRKG